MKILVIEDNTLLARSLQQGLSEHYEVSLARTGREGIDKALKTTYDLIILDLSLPDLQGNQVCQTLRREKVSAPIIVITGSTSITKKVALLNLGADDYITKPFSIEEVQARIRAVLRRSGVMASSPTVTAGILELDPVHRTLYRKGKPIELRRKEFDILEYLMTRPGKTMTRTMIVAHVWDTNENPWANVIDVHIKHLRDKIDRPYNSTMIKTVHGLGYKLEIS